MAAALASLNNYLDNIMGIHDKATRLTLKGQGLELFDDFLTYTMEAIIDSCTNIQRLGGTIVNPAFNASNIVPGVPANIPNPGIMIGLGIQKRLKILQYYIRHLNCIQHVMIPAQATLARLTACCWQKEEEDEDEDLDLPEKMTEIDKERAIHEDIDNHLIQKQGGSSQSYVVCGEVNLPLLDLGSRWPTLIDKMVSRGPLFGQYYQPGNIEVWQVVRHVTHGGPHWSWVQEFQQTRNGGLAYLAISIHYLGELYSSRISSFSDGESTSSTEISCMAA
jgi:hypothetical protein